MKLAALLDELKRREILLSAEGTMVKFRAPKGRLTTEIRDAIASHRIALLMVLKSEQVPIEIKESPYRAGIISQEDFRQIVEIFKILRNWRHES